MDLHNETAHKILDIAEHYTQTRGFNAFSYRDIQQDLGIKTSSIHYYFPTKQDLAVAMFERYYTRHQWVLSEIQARKKGAVYKLQAFADIFIQAAKNNKFCLCGMLAVEAVTMPDTLHKRLGHFFSLNEAWLKQVMQEGISAKELTNALVPAEEAANYVAALEGGLMIARVSQRPKYLIDMVKGLIARLTR